MRSLLIIASALFAFGATMTFESTEANAVVCAKRRRSRRLRRSARRGRRPQACRGLQDRGGERREGSPLHLSPRRPIEDPVTPELPQSGQPFADRTGGLKQADWRPVLTRLGRAGASFPDHFSVAQISGAD